MNIVESEYSWLADFCIGILVLLFVLSLEVAGCWEVLYALK